jgi:hypothetical protein
LTVLGAGILRGGTLLLGAVHGGRTSWLVAALTVQSAWTFGRGVWRARQGRFPALDRRAATVEAIAGVIALAVATVQSAPGSLSTSGFWVEPYTVITAVVLGAAGGSLAVGAAATSTIAAVYLACVLVTGRPGRGAGLRTTDAAAVWNNAVSYLPFFLIARIGFTLVRSVLGQSERLRQALARLASEQARLTVSAGAYRIGHDIPKALLREVRRGVMTAEDLGPWVAKYRDDLGQALGDVAPGEVHLEEELRALANAFAPVTRLGVDLAGLTQPASRGQPTLLIVEAVRELLNNASFHAYGFPVTLEAGTENDAVWVTVCNEGPGVDPLQLRSTWARKGNTVSQLEAAGGAYLIESRPDVAAGLGVTLVWPAAGTSLP